jgi:MFS family permease
LRYFPVPAQLKLMRKFFTKENDKLIFILVTMFLNFLGLSIIIPILPFLIQKFIPNPSQLAIYVGVVFSVYAFCQFLAARHQKPQS